MVPNLLKITFIPGLKEVVSGEIKEHPEINIIEEGNDKMYLDLNSDFKKVCELKSILNIYVVKRSEEFNPHFISKHKSILANLIDTVLKLSNDKFKTFKLSCAGSDSKDVLEIINFIIDTYKIEESEQADMDIFIGKSKGLWEVGVRATARPLSLREYKVENIKGGLNPTIAYAMNAFCNLSGVNSYINIFSGSATLLIEAGLINNELKLFGFDNNGKSIAQAVKNIKKAGLIKVVELKNADIFEEPDFGKFDVITSDLPFGMQISKGDDLEKLYKSFVKYSEKTLNPKGTLVIYTTENEILEPILGKSSFKIIKTLDLTVSTVVNKYIYPKIFVCAWK